VKDDIRRKAQELAAQQLAMDASAGMPGQPRVSFERSERQGLSDKGADNFVSMTFKSSGTGGVPHVVSRLPDGRFHCSCPAMLSIEIRPQGCWAMEQARRITGQPSV
jgi:hypothetical protein